MWYIHTTGYYSALKSLFSHSGYHMPNRLGDVFAQKGGGVRKHPHTGSRNMVLWPLSLPGDRCWEVAELL